MTPKSDCWRLFLKKKQFIFKNDRVNNLQENQRWKCSKIWTWAHWVWTTSWRSTSCYTIATSSWRIRATRMRRGFTSWKGVRRTIYQWIRSWMNWPEQNLIGSSFDMQSRSSVCMLIFVVRFSVSDRVHCSFFGFFSVPRFI